jgi:hypothetical protein
MIDPNFGPEWKPDVCKFVMNYQPNGTYAIATDPGHRTSWRREPYFSRLKQLSGDLLAQGVTMFVDDGIHRTIVTPDEEVVACRVSEEPNYEIFKDIRAGISRYRVVIKPAATAA